MSRAQLEQLLISLGDELDALERGGQAPSPRLRQLIVDVRAQIEAPTAEQGLVAELKQRVDAFEVEHPRLTTILNEVMVTLSNLGI